MCPSREGKSRAVEASFLDNFKLQLGFYAGGTVLAQVSRPSRTGSVGQRGGEAGGGRGVRGLSGGPVGDLEKL